MMNHTMMPYALNKDSMGSFFIPIKAMKLAQCITMVFVLLFNHTAHSANITSVLSLPDKLVKVGEGTMSWMFLDIYHASLYSQTGRYSEGDFPQVLTLNYLKSINKQRLIKATEEQWLLQKVDTTKVQEWLKLLHQIWPDINNGDSLTFYVNKNREGYFYYNQRLLGSINNNDFSDAFLAIWLSEKTSQPKLRRQLLAM